MISAAPFYLGPFLITPHPLSPHFATPTSAAEYFPSVAAELSSGHSTNREGYNLIRELCRVSYYSFMNGILRFSGIYDGLEDDLSLDMMNYRQSSLCEQPGAKAATFMPRGFSKSRVFTHGGLTFDFIRNPDESAIIVNAMQTVSETEHRQTEQALAAARDHIETDLHAEMRQLRKEIQALQAALAERTTR